MALTKIKRGGLDTGITDNSDANTLTFDSSENATFAGNVGIGETADATYPLMIKKATRYLVSLNNTSGSNYWWLVHDDDGTFRLHCNGVGDRLTLAQNGDATFSGQGTFNDNLNVIKSASATITIKGNAANANASLTFMEQSTTMWELRADGGSSDKLSFIDTGGAEVLSLGQDSSATFAGNIVGSGRLQAAVSLDASFAHELFNSHATGHGLKVRGGSTSSHYAFYVSDYNQTNSLLSIMGNGLATFNNKITVQPASGTDATLHLDAGGNGNAQVWIDAGTSTRHPELTFKHEGSNYWTVKSDPDRSNDFCVRDDQNSNTIQLRIAQSTGNATFAGDMNLTTANSKLGIGKTASSGWELDIETSSGNANARLKATATNQGARLEMDSHSGDVSNITFASSGTSKAQIESNVGSSNLIFKTGGTTAALTIDSSQIATFAGRVGIDSGGYTQQQLHVGDLGTLLLSHGTDTVGEYAGIFMRAEGGEENGMLRTKGLIAFERTDAWGVGKMKFCVNGDASNTAVALSDVALTIDSSKNATFAGDIGSGNFSSGTNITSDMNSLTKPGFYRIDNTDGINQPVNATHYSCIVTGKPPNVISQWAVHLTNGQTYTRCFNSSWSSWVRIDD